MDWETKLIEYKDAIVDFAPKLAGAIIVLIVGLWVVKKLTHLLTNVLERATIGPELSGFFSSMASMALKFILILMSAAIMGFEVSTVIGILA